MIIHFMNQTNTTTKIPERSRLRGSSPAPSPAQLLRQLTDLYRELGLSKDASRQAAIADLMMEGRPAMALAA